MPTKQKDAPQLSISPVLFMTVEGESMSFFLRPGPIKRDLLPLITAGGGTLCKVQQPGAILLLGPEEKGSIPESAAHWYVSTQYIHDCIEKDEQLELEAYRLKPEMVQRYATRLNSRKNSFLGLSGGRIPYTPEDDAAILKYVSQHKSEIGGNRLWQVMEKKRVTTHSWQSMKYRYKVRLSKKQTESPQVKAAGDSNKTAVPETQQEEPKQESDVEKPSSEEDAAPPQTHPADTDLTQIDNLYEPAGGDSGNKEAEAFVLAGEEEQRANGQSAESAQEESKDAEMSDQLEGPPVDPQTENLITVAETTTRERDELQTHSRLEDPPAAPQPESTPTPSSEKLKETLKASPDPEPPQGGVPLRQLELEAPSSSPESDTKKLGSPSTTTKQPNSPPGKETKLRKLNPQSDESSEVPPPKKARGQSPTPETEASRQAAVSETSPAGGSHSASEKGKMNKKEERPLGILQQAAREFDSESGEEEIPAVQHPLEEAVAAAEPVPPTSNAAAAPASPQSKPDPEPEPEPDPGHPEGASQSPQTSSSDPAAESVSVNPAAGEPAVCEPSVSDAVGPTSEAHLFIFESESQEDAACSRPTTAEAAAPSLTQKQLEEDVQLLKELMNRTKQSLATVTKALLRTSGDFFAAQRLLLNPSSVSGPLWRRSDDSKLLSGDSSVRRLLLEKYGEEVVMKRLLFLEVSE